MISHLGYWRNWQFLPITRGAAPTILSEWPSRLLRRRYNINKTVQMNVRAPKAPPMMGPLGSFGTVFTCTKTVVTPGVAPTKTVVAPSVAPNVGLDEEDSSVENDEEGDNAEDCGAVDGVGLDEDDSSVENDEEGDGTGDCDVVDEVG